MTTTEERPMSNEQRRWLSILRWIQLQRGYRLGWVSYTFEAKFGTRVELTFASEADIAPPDEEVLTFVEEKLLRFRAERAAEREADQVAAPPSGRRVHFVPASEDTPACGAIAPRRGARVTAEPVHVTCAACRRSLVWRETAPAPRFVSVCHMLEGGETRH
jgi:hypothetical protein